MSEEVLEKKSKKPVVVTIVIIAVIAIVAILIVSLTSKSGNANSYQSKLDEAQRYVDELSYELAIASFEEAIAIDPKAVEAYMGLAGVYLEMEDADSAIATLERALDYVSEDDKAIILAEIDRINSELEPASDAEEIVAENTDSDEYVPDCGALMHDVDMVLHYGNGSYWVDQYMAASYRRELAEPVIEEMEDYIAWLEARSDDERYASLFLYENEILNPGKDNGYGEVIDDVVCINYLGAYHYLFRLHMYMDDLDGAYAVRTVMNDIFGSEVVPMENFEINSENYIFTYDLYERVVRSVHLDEESSSYVATYEYDGANRIREVFDYVDEDDTVVTFYYDSEGRVVKAMHEFDGESNGETYEYPEYGTIIVTYIGEYRTGETEEWHFDEYGGIIE